MFRTWLPIPSSSGHFMHWLNAFVILKLPLGLYRFFVYIIDSGSFFISCSLYYCIISSSDEGTECRDMFVNQMKIVMTYCFICYYFWSNSFSILTIHIFFKPVPVVVGFLKFIFFWILFLNKFDIFCVNSYFRKFQIVCSNLMISLLDFYIAQAYYV